MSYLPHVTHVLVPKLVYLVDSEKAPFLLQHGFDPRRRPHELVASLRFHPINNQLEAVLQTPHGHKYIVRGALPSPDYENPCVVTVWMVSAGERIAEFVTAYASP